ncbi:phosphotransferase family protein [Corallococcus sp. H22C18031201]|uniref:phosphotransferase family protein n=1 Tax=Citreicoccus inhibens TaxID=2849499 RepID=UPI000E73E668|nr:phosphotransferase family protein [Citreicoccus inhibens]MBU8896665.1 phosphotransferase family protein [Citreicoccus inhibens]RJS14740.1 phosphotransferase family protein [Corallococcus sp. H22C18031201]
MTAEWQDKTREVRQGEELDAAWLERFLKEKLPELSGPLVVEQFPGGHSNLTYLLRVGEREMVLRRPPFGAKNIKAGHDMEREFRILSHLMPVFPRVPRPLVFCPEDGSPLGAPFYVMERVRGVILRGRPPKGLSLGESDYRRLSESFVDNLVALHAVDLQASGLASLGKPEGYLGRQVQGWTERYQKSKTDDLPEMEEVATWLAANLPPDTGAGATFIHNDYKYDNLVLDPDDLSRIRAVLDWEMATVADPLSDLGMALAYWIEPNDPEELRSLGIGLTSQPGNLSREELVARYEEKSGRQVHHLSFYFVLALFKVAVIAQQIYARFKRGYTKDERFAGLIFAVAVLGRLAAKAIESGGVKPPASL